MLLQQLEEIDKETVATKATDWENINLYLPQLYYFCQLHHGKNKVDEKLYHVHYGANGIKVDECIRTFQKIHS